jgi:ribosomal protein L11 methyltransferase
MNWIEASVTTTSGAADAVSEVLINNGAKGTQIMDRNDVPNKDDGTGFGELYGAELKSSLPEEVTVKAWFASLDEMLQAKETVQTLANLEDLEAGCLQFTLMNVKDEDWAENWKQYYKPLRVGKRLVIRPIWEKYDENPGDLVISMDPGMAFGTGTHETTRLCMEMIEAYYSGGNALDIGTGSGILAITLAKLGCQEVTAVDIDTIAVKAASGNVAFNGMSRQVKVITGDLTRNINGRYSFICANILADVIISLADPLRALMTERSVFLASGIIKDRQDDVLAAFMKYGFVLNDKKAEGEWVALLFGLRNA